LLLLSLEGSRPALLEGTSMVMPGGVKDGVAQEPEKPKEASK